MSLGLWCHLALLSNLPFIGKAMEKVVAHQISNTWILMVCMTRFRVLTEMDTALRLLS